MKAGCVEGLDWKGAVHIWTKRAVVQVPEGVETWEAQPDEEGLREGEKEAEAQHAAAGTREMVR